MRQRVKKVRKRRKKIKMSESRVRKFHKLFAQKVPEDENLINYFSCALVADILLQGHLYVSDSHFSFYSNVFGYITKLVLPISSVVFISKEKTAKMFPNAIGIQLTDTKHVFGSFLSREAAFQLMQGMVKDLKFPELTEGEKDTQVTESSKEDSSSISSESPAQFKMSDELDHKEENSNLNPVKMASPEDFQRNTKVQEEPKRFQEAPERFHEAPTSTILFIGIALTLILAFFSTFLLLRINSIENRRDADLPVRDYSQLTIDEAETVLNRNLMTVRNVRQKLEELQMILETSFGDSSKEEL